MKEVVFVGWDLSVRSGKELDRIPSGTKGKVAIRLPDSVEVVEGERVFDSEFAACRFALSELTKQYKVISEKSDALMARMHRINQPQEAEQTP